MIRVRTEKEANYRGIFCGGKTIRLALDVSKPITELKFPEFYDIKLTSKCHGNCGQCYTDSRDTSQHADNILEKLSKIFGGMDDNQRPFQCALGGGEPTEHPDFVKVLELLHGFGIVPNCTTNGMSVTDELVAAMKTYCGGVAISCHPHLKDYWESAAKKFSDAEIKLNFHLIISDKESIDYFLDIFNAWFTTVDYFVLLPYGNQGRAPHKDIDNTYLFSVLKNMSKDQLSKIAFGANFYEELKKHTSWLQLSLYEPELMSQFIDLVEMKVYPSSFSINAGEDVYSWLGKRGISI
jgi:organic radical activating enzyme